LIGGHAGDNIPYRENSHHPIAFSSKVGTGSGEENASNIKVGAIRVPVQSIKN
jgi:hypothetical protein